MFFFFLNKTPPTEISTLPLPAALPICGRHRRARSAPPHRLRGPRPDLALPGGARAGAGPGGAGAARRHLRSRRPSFFVLNRSEEHTSELQSRQYLVCRLLLEKKKQTKT